MQIGQQSHLQVGSRSLMIQLGAPNWLGNNLIDDLQIFEILCGQLERFCCLWCVVPVPPKNCGTTLRAKNRIVGVLKHQHAVSDANAQCASRTPFADHHRYDWRSQHHHFPQIDGDRLRNMPFLRAHSRVSPRCIYQRNNRQTKLGCQSHQPERLPVALGMRATKIPPDILLGIPTFLVRYYHAPMGSDRGESAWHRVIVTKQPISMELDEIAEGQFQIIQSKGTSRMSGDQDPLPSSEILVNLFSRILDLSFHCLHFTLEIDCLQFRMFFELLELLFQFDNRLFKFQRVRLHRMVTGESLPTNEYNSSISSAEISMPDFGFCAFGLAGFVSE